MQTDEHRKRTLLALNTGVLTSVIFSVVAFLRSPSLFLKPRMWAEEATWFYSQFQDMDFRHALVLVYRENYQLLTNLFVYAATLVPAISAAHVTTYLSCAVAIFVAYCLGLLVQHYNISWLVAFPLAAIWALLPPGYEIFYTVTNLQWVCSISMLVISALPLDKVGRRHRILFFVWAGACGLTGVPSCTVAPVFLLRGVFESRRGHLVIGLILAACTLFQIAVIATHPAVDVRYFPHSAQLLLLPATLQAFLTPILGADFIELVAVQIRAGAPHSGILVLMASLNAALVFALCTTLAWTHRGVRCLVLGLAALWIGASLVNTFGSLGDPSNLIAGSYNNRYFALGFMCFVLLLVLATGSPDVLARRISSSLLLVLTASYIAQATWSPSAWIIFDAGPRWRQQVKACAGQRPCTVTVWPTSAWTFQLRRP